MLLGPILKTLGVLTILAFVLSVVLAAGLLTAGGRSRFRAWGERAVQAALGVAWIATTAATVGSLYLSEGAGLMPCEYCWYQRIAMYPLAIILGVATVRKDAGVWRYTLPLSLIGLVIAVYHVVLQYLPSLTVKECTTAVPCTVAYFRVFGVLSIPFMAASVFLLTSVLLAAVAFSDRTGLRAGRNNH